jgi:hypothetical protein
MSRHDLYVPTSSPTETVLRLRERTHRSRSPTKRLPRCVTSYTSVTAVSSVTRV